MGHHQGSALSRYLNVSINKAIKQKASPILISKNAAVMFLLKLRAALNVIEGEIETPNDTPRMPLLHQTSKMP